MYHFDNFDDAYYYLLANGGYDSDEYLRQKPGEVNYKYESRILSIANRVYECMAKYPQEIYEFVRRDPSLPQYTFSELTTLSYRELSSLRNSLGIKKRNRRGKKVIRQEVAGEQYQNAISMIHDTPVREVAATIIQGNETEEKEFADEAILTAEEISSMFGEDMPSVSELSSMGIVPEYPVEYEKRLKLSFEEATKPKPKSGSKRKTSRDL